MLNCRMVVCHSLCPRGCALLILFLSFSYIHILGRTLNYTKDWPKNIRYTICFEFISNTAILLFGLGLIVLLRLILAVKFDGIKLYVRHMFWIMGFLVILQKKKMFVGFYTQYIRHFGSSNSKKKCLAV